MVLVGLTAETGTGLAATAGLATAAAPPADGLDVVGTILGAIGLNLGAGLFAVDLGVGVLAAGLAKAPAPAVGLGASTILGALGLNLGAGVPAAWRVLDAAAAPPADGISLVGTTLGALGLNLGAGVAGLAALSLTCAAAFAAPSSPRPLARAACAAFNSAEVGALLSNFVPPGVVAVFGLKTALLASLPNCAALLRSAGSFEFLKRSYSLLISALVICLSPTLNVGAGAGAELVLSATRPPAGLTGELPPAGLSGVLPPVT